MRGVGILLIGLFGIVTIVIGLMGARIPSGPHGIPADWLGYLCLGGALILSLRGKKREEEG